MNAISVSRSMRLFVGGVVLALASTAALTAMAQPGPRHGGELGWFSGRHMSRMLDSVQATDAQRAQIKQITQAAATDLRAQRKTGQDLRARVMDLFTQPVVDANAAEALRQQMLQQHDQSSRRITQAMLEISRVLTPEQRTQLGEQMKQRKAKMRRGSGTAPGTAPGQ